MLSLSRHWRMASGMPDPGMIEDMAKIVNEAIKDRVRVNLIFNNRAGGNAPRSARRSKTAFLRKSSSGCFEPF